MNPDEILGQGTPATPATVGASAALTPREASATEPVGPRKSPSGHSAALRKPLLAVLDCFRRLIEIKRLLHADMDACLKRIYALARTKSVTARPKRDPDGLLRRIHFVKRSKGRAHVNGHDYPQHQTLRAPINYKTVENVIRDLPHLRQWMEVWRKGRTLNASHALVALCHRNFRAALSNKFCPLATHEDRLRTAAILRSYPFLLPGDREPLVGAVVYDRLLQGLESRISEMVLRWKETMQAVPFEPMIRWRSTGPLRLSWAYVERFYDSQRNPQVRSVEIPGGVTDRWLRSHLPGSGVGRRKAILAFAAPMRALMREYSQLLVYVGRLKARIRRVLEEEISGVRPVAGAEGYRSA